MEERISKTITLRDGRKLGYIEYGDPNGKPLFFFHGWPGSRFSGGETDRATKKLGVRVVSTDRPGLGLSDFKKNRKLLDWPNDIVELADKLGIKKFSILGVSGGGPYSAVCAYKIPERIVKAGIVVGLAPVNIKGNLDGMAFQNKIVWKYYHWIPFLRKLVALTAALEFKYLSFLGLLMAFPAKEDKNIFKSLLKDSKGNGLREAFKQGIKGEEEELKVYTDDWGFDLSKIKAKVYLWYGAKDKNISLNMGRYYNSRIAGSKLFIDSDGGHLARYNFEEKILKKLL